VGLWASALFEGKGTAAELMLAGIFGGALAGAGVAVSYLGNGSTGRIRYHQFHHREI
jgi:uncharacterized membrane-anchored protein YitT (DUF2179 family)